MGRKLTDLTGQRFERLTAIEHPFKRNAWRCRCDCGREKWVSGWALRKGIVRSCGCLNSELSADRTRTHGLSDRSEYICWKGAKARCTNPNDKRWKDYGGRGIRMCDRWLNDFPAFLADLGPRPSLQYTLDRIDVNGNYEPGNVRWATKLQQANNATTNRRITWNGRTQTISEWCRELGINPKMAYVRLSQYGWTPDEAFTIGPRAIRHHHRRKSA